MRRSSSLLLLVTLPALAAVPASAQTVLFADDFENGTANWTLEDYWHLAADSSPCLSGPFPSGSHCMWYGIEATCNFEGPIVDFQDLRLAAPLALPTQEGGIFLDFWSFTHVEDFTSWDTRTVWVSTDGGAHWTFLFGFYGVPFEPWTLHTLDLSAYAGQTIDLKFTFWAGDTAKNNFLGWLIDDVVVRTSDIYPQSCLGDGSATACPCGNSSLPSERAGCLNSLGTAGRLRASGLASIADDNLTLYGSGMTSTTVLYYQGASLVNGGNGVVNGDGLSCTGGPIRRLGSTTNSAGASSFPLPGGQSVSVRGQVTAPGTRWYQARYRNSINFCTPDTFNSTNQIRVDWTL